MSISGEAEPLMAPERPPRSVGGGQGGFSPGRLPRGERGESRGAKPLLEKTVDDLQEINLLRKALALARIKNIFIMRIDLRINLSV